MEIADSLEKVMYCCEIVRRWDSEIWIVDTVVQRLGIGWVVKNSVVKNWVVWKNIGEISASRDLKTSWKCIVTVTLECYESRRITCVWFFPHDSIELGYYHSWYLLEETENSKHSAVWTTNNYFIVSVKLLAGEQYKTSEYNIGYWQYIYCWSYHLIWCLVCM